MRLLLTFAVTALVLSVAAALAEPGELLQRPHRHPPEDAAIHERFYSTWTMPDYPDSPCCNDEDCYPTEARRAGDGWQMRHRETGDWVDIPPRKLEQNQRDGGRDSPDGRSHMCANKHYKYVHCAVLGGGL